MRLASRLHHFLDNPRRSVSNVRYRWREHWRRQTTQVNPQPILIFGNQKSGTSAITTLLGEATGLSYTIDIFCLYANLEEQILAGQNSFDELLHKGRYYFSKDIIKDPGLTFFYSELRTRFPQAKRVFILRDPRQNIRSILNRLGLPGHLQDLSAEDWHRVRRDTPSWLPVLDGRLAGHHGRTHIETLALRCKKAFQIYLQHQAEVTPIYYETFKANKIGTIQTLARLLGLSVVHDISYLQDVQFQPKGNASVSLEAFFGPDNFNLIETICGETMTAVGYRL